MWKLGNAANEITIDEIKNFADYQQNDTSEREPAVRVQDQYVPEDMKGFSVCTPWMDDSGRYELTDEQAEQQYTKEGVDDFKKRAEEYLKKHRLVMWEICTDTDNNSRSIGLFKNTADDGKETYFLEIGEGTKAPVGPFGYKDALIQFNAYVAKHNV